MKIDIEKLQEKKISILKKRDSYTRCRDEISDEGLKYLYDLKIAQCIGAVDLIDDLLEESKK